jgi:hypothetical protein
LEQQQQQLHALQGLADGYRGITAGETASSLAESDVARAIAHLREVRGRRARQNAVLAATLVVLGVMAFFAILAFMRR